MQRAILPLLLVMLLVTGCTTVSIKTSRKLDFEKVAGIEKGITTKEDVLREFGTPYSIAINPTGFEVYNFIEATSETQSWLIPPIFTIYVDSIQSGVARCLSITFKDDIVLGYMYAVANSLSAGETPSKHFKGATLDGFKK